MHSNRFCFRAASLAVCVIGVVLPLAAQNHAHYGRSELRKMMREASTVDQYRTLATWFREEEAAFREKAEAQAKKFEGIKTSWSKQPTSVDTARAARDNYLYKADRMATLAKRYETELSRLDPNYRAPSAAAPAPPCQDEKMLLDRIERLEQQNRQPRQ